MPGWDFWQEVREKFMGYNEKFHTYRKPIILTLQNSTSAEILAEDLVLSIPRFEDQLTALIASKAPSDMIENKMMVIDGLRGIYRDSALKNAQLRAQQK